MSTIEDAARHGSRALSHRDQDRQSGGDAKILYRHHWTARIRARPDFGYPGAWLGCTQPGGVAILHVYAGGPALGSEGKAPAGTAAIDHVSLSCSGYRSYISRFKAAKLEWREFIVPGTSLWQLFVYDPSGVQLELTFESGGEGEEKPDMSAGRKYTAGSTFFDKATYPKLA